MRVTAVSYTHLDVYKRQDLQQVGLQGAPLLQAGTVPRVDFAQMQGLMRWRVTCLLYTSRCV